MRNSLLLLLVISFSTLAHANIESAARGFRRSTIGQSELTGSLLLCRVEVAGKDGGWDSFGGAPDVSMRLKVSGDTYLAKANNTHRPYLSFADIDLRSGEKLTVTLADIDSLSNDDPIGERELHFERTPFTLKASRFSLECRSVDPKLVAKKTARYKRAALIEAKASKRLSSKAIHYPCPSLRSQELERLGAWSGKKHDDFLDVMTVRSASCEAHRLNVIQQHQTLFAKAVEVQKEKRFGPAALKVSQVQRKNTGSECTFTVYAKQMQSPPRLSLFDSQGKRKYIRRVTPPLPVPYKAPTDEKIEFATQCKGVSEALLYLLDIEGRTLKSRAFRLSD